MNRRTRLLTIGGLAVALVAGGGTALAAATGPVSSSGVITGCYTNGAVNGSHAVVLQNGGTSCPQGTSAISWDQTGPQGPPGPAGTNGTNGTDGTNGSNGTDGTDGTNGTDGANGASIMTSEGFPPAAPCTPGDTDIELTGAGAAGNGEVLTCNNSDMWTDTLASIQGPAGAAGASIMTSQGFPPSSCTPGDTDIVLTPSGAASSSTPNGEVLTCNSAGTAWTDTGSSIEGPQGPAGPSGATGAVSSLDQLNGIPCDNGTGTVQLSYDNSSGDSSGAASITCVTTLTPSPATAVVPTAAVNMQPPCGGSEITEDGFNTFGSVAWFRMEVDAGCTITVQLNTNWDVFDVYPSLADATAGADALATGVDSDTTEAAVAGIWYIEVYENPTGGLNGPYTLSVTGTDS
jgi:Collagen triple helix repeat (20 copies)